VRLAFSGQAGMGVLLTVVVEDARCERGPCSAELRGGAQPGER